MRILRRRYEIAGELESIIPRDIRRILCESGLPFLPGTGAFSKLENLELVNSGTSIAFTDMAYTDRLVVDMDHGTVMRTHHFGIPMTFVNSDLELYEASFSSSPGGSRMMIQIQMLSRPPWKRPQRICGGDWPRSTRRPSETIPSGMRSVGMSPSPTGRRKIFDDFRTNRPRGPDGKRSNSG